MQQVCDQLDAAQVQGLCARCLGSVPLPLTVADRHAGMVMADSVARRAQVRVQEPLAFDVLAVQCP